MILRQPQHPALPNGTSDNTGGDIDTAIANIQALRDRAKKTRWITDAAVWLSRAEAVEGIARRFAQLVDSGTDDEVQRALFQLRAANAGAVAALAIVDDPNTSEEAIA